MSNTTLQPRFGANGEVVHGPNGMPMHHLLRAANSTGAVQIRRYLLLRRLSQTTILLLFFGTVHWGWTLAGAPLLTGNLSASEFAGIVPMADPFAVLQILATGYIPELDVLLGAGIILAFYALLTGRAFCSWVCPLNMVTDFAAWLRRKIGLKSVLKIPRSVRYVTLGISLVLSALAGVAAFEWISPISLFHRELIYGAGMGWMALLGVFMLDLFVVKNGWCGHLCPLGAFYSLLGGRTSRLVVRFDRESCTHCAECATVCPEPQVLNLKIATLEGRVGSECTNCGRCVALCPENSLRFDWRRNVVPLSHESRLP